MNNYVNNSNSRNGSTDMSLNLSMLNQQQQHQQHHHNNSNQHPHHHHHQQQQHHHNHHSQNGYNGKCFLVIYLWLFI